MLLINIQKSGEWIIEYTPHLFITLLMKYQLNMNKNSIGIVLAITLLFACKNKVETAYPSIEKITHSVYASGIVKSYNQYQVYAKVNGVITQIFVQDGAFVKKGQAIIKLGDDAQKLNYENAKLLANYSDASVNKEKLQQAQTEMDVAKLKMENELSLLDRQKKLWSQEIGTKNDIDQRELLYKNAASNYNASKLRLNDLKKLINFQSEQTKRTASISSTSMNDFMIKSEIDGKIYSLSKEKGEMVNTQTPIAVIGDASKFYVELQVDEYDISKLVNGQKVLLTMDSYKGEVFEATISKMYSMMNERSKSFKVEAIFTKQPQNLYPNLTTEANIIIEVKEKAITIPRNYLIGNDLVLLANQEKRKVTIGLKDYEKVEILSGITTKDQLFKPAQ
jgi:multidrug efflux pump subunit AcrA (membrane-fusion protein)